MLISLVNHFGYGTLSPSKCPVSLRPSPVVLTFFIGMTTRQPRHIQLSFLPQDLIRCQRTFPPTSPIKRSRLSSGPTLPSKTQHPLGQFGEVFLGARWVQRLLQWRKYQKRN